MGGLGKKKKNKYIRCVIPLKRENGKNADLGTYIKGSMGKSPKMAIFVDFDPVNLKSGKNHIAYHVGNFARISKMLSIFYQKYFFVGL